MGFTCEDIRFIRDLVRERAGIVLDEEKEYLIVSRLEPLAKELGFESLITMVGKLRRDAYDMLHRTVVEAMTTHETSFFRDVSPFLALRERLLPDLIAHKSSMKRLSIWCGACSSGQEPYSIMLTILEHFPQLQDWDISFEASDISAAMVKRCQDGIYSQLEVNRGLPANLLAKYFSQQDGLWRIDERVRRKIQFREINLAGPWPPFPRLDLVVLRNVLIYFDGETKKRILKKIHHILNPQGYLMLGGSETTINVDDRFERVPMNDTSCYRLRKD